MMISSSVNRHKTQSPERSENTGTGTKILKRELWWKEPPPTNRVEVRNQPIDLGKVTSRVDHVSK